ncbi:hypothetical protein KCU71_g159, partial [Aureobasidium melanogenum]
MDNVTKKPALYANNAYRLALLDERRSVDQVAFQRGSYSTNRCLMRSFVKLWVRFMVMNCLRRRCSCGRPMGLAGNSMSCSAPTTEMSPPLSPGWSFCQAEICATMSDVVLSSS